MGVKEAVMILCVSLWIWANCMIGQRYPDTCRGTFQKTKAGTENAIVGYGVPGTLVSPELMRFGVLTGRIPS